MARQDTDLIKYQFQASRSAWEKWKSTVPRSKSLETRINELIEADTEGRVVEERKPIPREGGACPECGETSKLLYRPGSTEPEQCPHCGWIRDERAEWK